jgi:hypothetical protein
MTFEQPANLNQYIAPTAQFTWGFRWKLFKSSLPPLFLLGFLFSQAILFRGWIRGQWDISSLLGVLIVLALLMFSVEIQLRLSQKFKRILKLEENYVRFGSGLAQRVGWSNIIAWQFNHLAHKENYRVATMEYKWRRKLRRHTIVLEKSQMEQLISEVKSCQQKDSVAFSIADQESNFIPRPFEIKKVRALKLYLYLGGAFLFIEGLPFLMIGLGAKTHSPNPDFVPNPNGSFAKFITGHFSSVAELRHFGLVTGTILCASGLILIIWSSLPAGAKNPVGLNNE